MGFKPKKKSNKEKFYKDKFTKMVKDPNKLLKQLKEFNVEACEDKTIEDLEDYINENKTIFDKQNAYNLSLVFGILSDWLFANIKYYKVF